MSTHFFRVSRFCSQLYSQTTVDLYVRYHMCDDTLCCTHHNHNRPTKNTQRSPTPKLFSRRSLQEQSLPLHGVTIPAILEHSYITLSHSGPAYSSSSLRRAKHHCVRENLSSPNPFDNTPSVKRFQRVQDSGGLRGQMLFSALRSVKNRPFLDWDHRHGRTVHF